MKLRLKSILIYCLSFIFVALLALPSLAQTEEDCLTCHDEALRKNIEGSIHGAAGLSCLDCHQDLRGVKEFPHAEKLEPARCESCHSDLLPEWQKSIHSRTASLGFGPVRCFDCHGGHEVKPKTDPDSKVYPLNLPQTCERCHLGQVTTPRGQDFIRQYQGSIHFRALEKAGLTISANCSHCHGSHDILSIEDPASKTSRRQIIHTCGQCHVGIERDYLEGVHGKDYVKGIKDVPVCIDCHQEHNILSPLDTRSSVYATRIAGVCSRCHDDQAIARQYGLLTSRYKTYAETYHGTASRYGDIRVANCASCHGYHDIRPSSDPKSSIHPANIPQTCGRCHPGASRRFAEGKVHLMPDQVEIPKYRVSYLVKTIYIALIVVIISAFLLFIAADLGRRLLGGQRHG
jgi:hypothetical protein